MLLSIKSPIEEYKYVISPDIAEFIRGYLDNLSAEKELVVKIKGESLLGGKE